MGLDGAKVVQAVTGWDVDTKELMIVGARRVNLMKVFNAREGFTARGRQAFQAAARAAQRWRQHGLQITEEELEAAKDLYYRLAGWDVETGNPTAERLEELGIGWAAAALAEVPAHT